MTDARWRRALIALAVAGLLAGCAGPASEPASDPQAHDPRWPKGALAASEAWSPPVSELNLDLASLGAQEFLAFELRFAGPATLTSEISIRWPPEPGFGKCIARQLGDAGGLVAFGDSTVMVRGAGSPPVNASHPLRSSQQLTMQDTQEVDGREPIYFLLAIESARTWAQYGATMNASIRSDVPYQYRVATVGPSLCITSLHQLEGGEIIETPLFQEARDLHESFEIAMAGYAWAGVEADISAEAYLRHGETAVRLGPPAYHPLPPGDWRLDVASIRARESSILLFVVDLPPKVVEGVSPAEPNVSQTERSN